MTLLTVLHYKKTPLGRIPGPPCAPAGAGERLENRLSADYPINVVTTFMPLYKLLNLTSNFNILILFLKNYFPR